jgi:hypothetical protein
MAKAKSQLKPAPASPLPKQLPYALGGALVVIIALGAYITIQQGKDQALFRSMMDEEPEYNCLVKYGSSPKCYAEVLEKFPKMCNSWNMIGVNLPNEIETVTVNGKPFNKRKAFRQGINCNPSLPHSWFNLAMLLKPGETVRVRGEQRNQLELLLHALERGLESAAAWNSVAALLPPHMSTATIGDVTYDRPGLIRKALEVDPELPFIWRNVASLAGESLFEFKGSYYSAEEAMEKASELEAKQKGKGSGSSAVKFDSVKV